MKKLFFTLMILLILIIVTVSSAFAQTAQQLQLGLSRDFGYGGLNNDIQGLFTVRVKNPADNLTKVDFYLDTTLMGQDTATPFSLQFNTDSYPLGAHTISAVGYTSDGQTLDSNTLQVQFVPASTGMQSVVKIVGPIVLLLVVIGLIAVFLPLILSRGKLARTPLGEPRKYGIGGGAVCPKCNRPFQLRLWWINLGGSKIDRCPYCGKWSMVRPRSLDELRAAEAAELSQVSGRVSTGIEGQTEADKLKKELDESRFQDQ